MKYLISPCLLGICTRWNESNDEINALVELVWSGETIFICPEQIGGMSTPRAPTEVEPRKTAREVLAGEGKVFSDDGIDVTREFTEGARRILEFCQQVGVDTPILKADSPSCGLVMTYDGTFSETTIPGKGVTGELLGQQGIKVYNEKNFPSGGGS